MDRSSFETGSAGEPFNAADPVNSEEFEQIPWSSLVADQTTGVDRRVYVVIGAVALLVAAILGSRVIGGSTQPAALELPSIEVVGPDASGPQSISAPSSTVGVVGVVVSEADLMAELPTVSSSDNLLAVTFAEWFVTDYFTTDGSLETEESVVAMMFKERSTDPRELPRPPDGSYVEWARATGVEAVDESSLAVAVLFRTIRSTSDGFVRDPVSAVSVLLVTSDEATGMMGPPVTIPVPELKQISFAIDQRSVSETAGGTP